jgi:hypothetical protein
LPSTNPGTEQYGFRENRWGGGQKDGKKGWKGGKDGKGRKDQRLERGKGGKEQGGDERGYLS